ncbi:MAG: HNH endonuclease [Sporomusaceae bacterium]|nr:HNH endonuclease [Sporomusaceae bacterium]
MTQFDIQVLFRAGETIEDFHQWANKREHVGVFKIIDSTNTSYYLAFIDWAEKDNYYAVVFDSKKNRSIAELHKIKKRYDGLDLCWTYGPSKQDGKNNLRKQYFARHFGNVEVRIQIPQHETEIDLFLNDIVILVQNRLKADELEATVDYREGFPEGRTFERIHKQKEKSSKVIKLAKQNAKERDGKLVCEVCNFSFADCYGDLGVDYIEAHHTLPVSELEEGHVTQVEDIALVCSNCHKMLHRRRPWLLMNELNKILKS